MISKLRKNLWPLQEVLSFFFIALGLSPNQISFLGVILAAIGAFFIMQSNWVVGAIFFILAPSMDLVDGYVARKTNKKSNFGNYFDAICDKLIEFFILGSIALHTPFLGICALGFSLLTSYTKPRVGLIIITDNHDWPSIGEHAEKMLIALLVVILMAVGVTTFANTSVIEIGLGIIAIISLLGFIQRVIYAKNLITVAEKKGELLPYIKKNKER
jgi:phosphatidylglycerophosphate synthase